MIYAPDNNPNHPLLDGLSVQGFLNKPFSGSEIGKALANLFSDQPFEVSAHQKQLDDLMKEWLGYPATGQKISSQILNQTKAQSALLFIKGTHSTSAGQIDETLIHEVGGFLARVWKDNDQGEIGRFITLDGNSEDVFLYATKLVGSVVLVLLYPNTATIHQVRRELKLVKNDFQKNYPSISELRQEIAERAITEIRQRSEKLETHYTSVAEVSQSELDELNRLIGSASGRSGVVKNDQETLAEKTISEIRERSKNLSTFRSDQLNVSQSELDALTQAPIQTDQSHQPVKLSTEELAEQALAEIRERNKKLAEVQSKTPTISQSDRCVSARSQSDPKYPANREISTEDLAEQALAEIRERN